MNIKIEAEMINTLLGRKELTVQIDNQGSTPTKQEVVTAVSSAVSADSKLIVIDTISQSFGSQESIASIKVYDSEEAMTKAEPKPKKSEEKKEQAGNVPDASGEMKVQVDEPAEGEKSAETPKGASEGELKGEAPKEEQAKEKLKTEETKGAKPSEASAEEVPVDEAPAESPEADK